MKLTDDFEKDEIRSGLPLGAMMAGVVGFVILVVVVVFITNKPEEGRTNPGLIDAGGPVGGSQTAVSQNTAEDEYVIGESNLVSDDLDFWNMYKTDYTSDRNTGTDRYTENLQALEKEEKEEEKEEDLSENGTKTEVILPDGTSQWIMINAYIRKNEYDYTGLVFEEPFMRYYSEGKKSSKQGIWIDDSYGSIDFARVEDDGVDFCIVRIGRRGYSTGAVSMEQNYLDYITEAKAAGLSVGVSFYSQAVTEEEAIEEANFVIAALQEADIKPEYPIVFDMELVSNDNARTENLTKAQLTQIAKAFCNTVRQSGYTPVIYGNKYWLLRKLDLTQLFDYNIYLSQEGDIPDYPYEFAMWEYKQDAKINGIVGNVAMTISFIDYDMR
ncbi:MAG: hypothetical protein J1E61_08120 [Lachnospiraceae bacterium]|nr:hypothetical protein [Lachnospiraceae bacterium]